MTGGAPENFAGGLVSEHVEPILAPRYQASPATPGPEPARLASRPLIAAARGPSVVWSGVYTWPGSFDPGVAFVPEPQPLPSGP